jgi:hypothetical protein
MSISSKQILLPIWHDITKVEVTAYSPSLAGTVCSAHRHHRRRDRHRDRRRHQPSASGTELTRASV